MSRQDLCEQLDRHLGHKVEWIPINNEGTMFRATHEIKAELYQVKDSTVYVIETNGVLTLATD